MSVSVRRSARHYPQWMTGPIERNEAQRKDLFELGNLPATHAALGDRSDLSSAVPVHGPAAEAPARQTTAFHLTGLL